MKQDHKTKDLSLFERLIVGFDVGPAGAAYRVAVGFLIVLSLEQFTSVSPSTLVLSLYLLAWLLALRGVPLVLRALLPVSQPVRAIWFERRQMAKRFDSYQWKKLFWIGLGMALHVAWSGKRLPPEMLVSSFCLLSGGLGLLAWHKPAPRDKAGPTFFNQAQA